MHVDVRRQIEGVSSLNIAYRSQRLKSHFHIWLYILLIMEISSLLPEHFCMSSFESLGLYSGDCTQVSYSALCHLLVSPFSEVSLLEFYVSISKNILYSSSIYLKNLWPNCTLAWRTHLLEYVAESINSYIHSHTIWMQCSSCSKWFYFTFRKLSYVSDWVIFHLTLLYFYLKF